MFRKLSEQELLKRLNARKTEIKNLDKLPTLDSFYMSFISKYESLEIIPDIEIFGYEEALKENRNLETNYPIINQIVWMIGRTGQGDEWFISKEKSSVLFFDHNQGEYFDIKQFVNFNISFFKFLQMAFLYQKLENILDEQEKVDKHQIDTFIRIINSIHPDLFKLYPFKYF